MTKAIVPRRAVAAGLVALVLVAGYLVVEQGDESIAVAAPAMTPSAAGEPEEAPGFLYGRVTTHGGDTYEGRLRWGGDEEAFWSDYFNGRKVKNPWAVHVPNERLIGERPPARVFGFEISRGEGKVDLGRPFMARFGDIVRIESRGDGVRGVIENRGELDPEVRVTLKSGTTSASTASRPATSTTASGYGTPSAASPTSEQVTSAPSNSFRPLRSAASRTGSTEPSALAAATSLASSSGTVRRSSAPTRSSAARTTGSAACASTASGPSPVIPKAARW